jgi:hypothetical protein
MTKPNIPTLMDAVPVSKSYASVILNVDGKQRQSPPLNLAALIYQRTGWRHPSVAELSHEALVEIAEKQPWSPPKERAA